MSRRHSPEQASPNFYERYYTYVRKYTIGRMLGKTACGELQQLESRMDVEIESAIVESLNGRVASEYSFDVVNGSVMAGDGEKLRTLLQRAVDVAEQMAVSDPYYAAFLPQRTRNELREHLIVEELVSGLGHNASIVISPYSEEYDLGDGRLEKAFQRPDCQRAMLRITYWDGHKVHMITRSLDYATVAILKETARISLSYDYADADSTAMQGDVLMLSLESLDEARSTAESIVGVFDTLQQLATGTKTRQGRRLYEDANLQLFVTEKCGPLISSLKKDLKKAAKNAHNSQEFKSKADSLFYNYLALADKIINGHEIEGDISAGANDAGAQASSEGTTYNVCGVVIESGNPRADVSAKTGYESLMLLSKKMISCPDCHKKVIIEDKLLQDGILHCRECGKTVDVCGDKEKEARYKKSLQKKKTKDIRKNSTPQSLFALLFGGRYATKNASHKERLWPF